MPYLYRFHFYNRYFSSRQEWSLYAGAALYVCAAFAVVVSKEFIKDSSAQSSVKNFNHHNFYTMETNVSQTTLENTSSKESGSVLLKAVITGVLILALLIPTFFIQNLVSERQERRNNITKEVSAKWANAQTISGPYIVVPYKTVITDNNGKTTASTANLVLLPQELNMNGNIVPEERARSIYEVLLYNSELNFSGFFSPADIAAEVSIDSLLPAQAKLCMGISDFKGIQNKVSVSFNNVTYNLQPGMASNAIDSQGLFAKIPFTKEMFSGNLPFKLNIKIRGSEQLHFLPLSAAGRLSLKSSFANPSFDGNSLPSSRQIDKSGFAATWEFNEANLPFTTIINNEQHFDAAKLAFGVTMLQPTDQYAMTMRCAKYAILFIGLTFAFFFVIEILQNKPLHPVQYVLVGIALSIFYTLLLSISEFILFDYAYIIAASATVALISLYIQSYLRNWKTASLFAASLSALYALIYVLISLEDTALIIGSVSLFLVLAAIMYGTRKVDWYHPGKRKK